jgi:hypothetical protein
VAQAQRFATMADQQRLAVQYMINHVFLPPNVPQKDDTDPFLEEILLHTISTSLEAFRFHTDEHNTIKMALNMIDKLCFVRDESGMTNEKKVKNSLERLSGNGKLPVSILNTLTIFRDSCLLCQRTERGSPVEQHERHRML